MTEFTKNNCVYSPNYRKSTSSFLLSLAVETPCLWGLW